MIRFFLVFMCVSLPIKGVAMSMFSENEQEVVLFSPIEGVITFKGQPASGANIVRWIKWKDEEGTKDSVLVGADGGFYFPVREAVIKRSPVSKFVVNQRLTVFFEDEEYVIWAMGNGN